VNGPVIAPGTAQRVSFNEVGNGSSCAQLGIATVNVGDSFDILAFAPAITPSGGSNLIASGNWNFTGWQAYMGALVTLTQGQSPITADSMDFLPFGEQIAGGSFTSHKFTGDERDSETNLDHTQFRQYSSQLGRWMHPDPAGLSAVDPSNPQSWNRYAYVLNNPLAFLDHLGLDCVYFDNEEETEWHITPGDCGENDEGYYVDGTVNGTYLTVGGQLAAVTVEDNTNYQQLGTSLGDPSIPQVTMVTGDTSWWGAYQVAKNFDSIFNAPSFVKDQFTNPESCLAAFGEAIAEPGTATFHGAEASEAVGPGLISTAQGVASFAKELHSMLTAPTGPKLDPFLGPIVIAGARGLASSASRLGFAAEHTIAKARPTAALVAIDLTLLYGVIQEGRAARNGKCH